ncbi:MAG TPA: hypothetical protein VFM46_00765, partial [Pseudomonadales bacterium]|nr:hypothetical protein [Pseudomonadales bacterium]
MKFNLSKKQKLGLGVIALTPALYAAAGFWLLPRLALSLINQELKQYSQVPAQLDRVEFNPFTLELTLRGFKAAEAIQFETLYANLQIDSLWHRTLHLKEVQLKGAQVSVTLAKNGDLNLATLLKLPKSEAEKKPSE